MAGSKPRDGQKQRVYNAQTYSGLLYAEKSLSIKESQAFVNKVIKQEFTKKLFEKHKFWASKYPSEIIVEASSGCHATIKNRGWQTVRLIRLNSNGRNRFIILHEIAHHLTWGHEGHGAEFAEVFLKLVKRHLGAHSETLLQNSFHEYRVKVSGKSGKARVPRKREIQSAKLVA